MNNAGRIGIVAALLVVIGVTLALKQKGKTDDAQQAATPAQPSSSPAPAAGAVASEDRTTGRAPESSPADGASVKQDRPSDEADSAKPLVVAPATSVPPASAPAALPRLVDLGAGKCIPCKMMAPILEELKKEYAGRMKVEFIDVWVNPKAGDVYGIRAIPTQIFYDASGKELFRHEGFFSRDDILKTWKEFGVDLAAKPAGSVGQSK